MTWRFVQQIGVIGSLLALTACQRSPAPLFQPMNRPVPTVTLVRSSGDTLQLPRDLKGHWTVLGWIYTSCPDVCPLTTQIFRTVRDSLEAHGVPASRIQLWLVSFDPEVDSLPRLAEYAAAFEADRMLVFLRADPGELLTLSEALEFHFKRLQRMEMKETGHPMPGMRFAHDVRQYLINPQGTVVGVHTGTVDHPVDPDSLIQTLLTLEAS